MTGRRTFMLAAGWRASLAVLACGITLFAQASCARHEEAVAISDRGPGTRRQPPESLALPVPRTLDLAHLQVAHVADALGKDTGRMFEFVRDQVSYEAYTGALRGPRGTLIAMAGNSVDRASLLAGMLKRGGQKVRFASGRLPQDEAIALVTSMWALPRRTQPEVAAPDADPLLNAALSTLNASVDRDLRAIRDLIRGAPLEAGPGAAVRVPALAEEARDHYWVQVAQGDGWIDFDPSFADAAPGRTYASAASTFDALPESLFHRIDVRVRVEELDDGKLVSRELLKHSARAQDLSGADLLLSHQPDTDRLRPVLAADAAVFTGEPFRSRPPSRGGTTGIFNQLSGLGTRKAVPLAVAEYLDIDLIAPDGSRRHVARKVFDVIGDQARASGRVPETAEIERLTSASGSDPAQMVLDLFFTTGRLDTLNLLAPGTAVESHEHDVRAGLRSISIGFGAVSDALTAREERPGKSPILFYPASARVWIAAFSTSNGKGKLTLDLRHSATRAAALDADAQDALLARVSHGVINATLERLLLDYLTAEARDKNEWEPVFSGSTLFERARQTSVPLLLLPRDVASLDGGIPPDARAALQRTPGEYVVVAPQRAVSVDSKSRLAWWQIDRATGETTAVTDDGLHGAQVEYQFVRSKTDNRVVGATVWRDGQVIWQGVFRVGGQRIVRFMQIMGRVGAQRLPPRVF